MPMATIYTYSRSQGLFAGISLEGIVIGARDEINTEYYGQPVTPEDILSGKVSPHLGRRDFTNSWHSINSLTTCGCE
jgi:lipid-binding SYLF domain-containing protein